MDYPSIRHYHPPPPGLDSTLTPKCTARERIVSNTLHEVQIFQESQSIKQINENIIAEKLTTFTPHPNYPAFTLFVADRYPIPQMHQPSDDQSRALISSIQSNQEDILRRLRNIEEKDI